MRRTKIVATIGPATSNLETAKKLINAGLNVARINFSHGSYESHAETIKIIKAAREELKAPVALMLDTKGPEIRLRTFENEPVLLKRGENFTLTTRDVIGDESCASVDHADLPNDLAVGARVLIDDGLVGLRVVSIEGSEILCAVENSGEVGSRKGVNLPDSKVSLPAITPKDIEDIKFGITMGFDYLAASFVRSAKDVLEIRQILEDYEGSHIQIIAKIENREGVDNIEAILEVSDGIMVARGDLGVEIPPEEVPLVQKQLIKRANMAGKPVITATHMLESMITNPRPTRAEATDVATAIFDGTDAVMLSGETAKGAYPVEAVKMMDRIAIKVEEDFDYSIYPQDHSVVNVTNAIAHAACATANELEAACIVTTGRSGFTARMVSKFRTSRSIVAMSNDETVWRQMSLIWGVLPYLQELTDANLFTSATKASLELGLAQVGDIVVIAAGVPIGVAGSTNLIKVEIVGDVLVKGQGDANGRMGMVVGKTSVIKPSEDKNRVFQEGDILVAASTDDSMMNYIRKAGAVVVGTDQKTDFTHIKISCKALRKPLLVCNVRVIDIIRSGVTVTIDFDNGFVYNGLITDLNPQ